MLEEMEKIDRFVRELKEEIERIKNKERAFREKRKRFWDDVKEHDADEDGWVDGEEEVLKC